MPNNNEIVRDDGGDSPAPADIRRVLDEVSERWLRTLEVSDDTRTAYRKGLRLFTEWLRDEEIVGEFAATEVERYKEYLDESRGLAAASINLYLSALRAFMSWCVTQRDVQHLTTNPLLNVSNVRENSDGHKKRPLSGEEINDLLEAFDENTVSGARGQALAALMAYAGARTIELHRANVNDLFREGKYLRLAVQGKGKTNKADFVTITDRALELVRPWLDKHPGLLDWERAKDEERVVPLFISLASNSEENERLTRRSIRRIVRDKMDEVGITDNRKTVHSLRHSAITRAIRNGAELPAVQAMARHDDPNTTMTYVHEVNRIDNPAEEKIDW